MRERLVLGGVLLVAVLMAIPPPGISAPLIPAQGGTAEITQYDGIFRDVATSSTWVYAVGAKTHFRHDTFNASRYNSTVVDGLVAKYGTCCLNESWNRTYDFGGAEGFEAVALDSDGNGLLVGHFSNASGTYLLAAKIRENGSLVWTHTAPWHSVGYAAGIASDGWYWVAGLTNTTSHYLLRLDPSTGSVNRQCTFQFSGKTDFQMTTGISFASDGDVVLVGIEGEISPPHDVTDGRLVRLSQQCEVRWSSVRSDPNNIGVQFWDLALVSSSATVAGTRGQFGNMALGHVMLAEGRNAANGTLNWTDEYSEIGLHDGWTWFDVATGPGPYSYASGISGVNPAFMFTPVYPYYMTFSQYLYGGEMVSAKYAADGQREWLTKFGSVPHDFYAFGNSVLTDGSALFVTGAKVKRAMPGDNSQFIHPFLIKYTQL